MAGPEINIKAQACRELATCTAIEAEITPHDQEVVGSNPARCPVVCFFSYPPPTGCSLSDLSMTVALSVI